MGDRTTARVKVRKEFRPVIEAWANDGKVAFNEDWADEGLHVVEDPEANYGEMDDLIKLLEYHGIPYDHEWERGNDFEPGMMWARIVGGGIVSRSVVKSETVVSLAEVADALRFNDSLALDGMMHDAGNCAPLEPALRETEITSRHRRLIREATFKQKVENPDGFVYPPTRNELQDFVGLVASMDTSKDFERRGHEMSFEDAASTVDSVIEKARSMLLRCVWDEEDFPGKPEN